MSGVVKNTLGTPKGFTTAGITRFLLVVVVLVLLLSLFFFLVSLCFPFLVARVEVLFATCGDIGVLVTFFFVTFSKYHSIGERRSGPFAAPPG